MTTELHLLGRRYLSVKINDPPPPHPSFVFKSLFQKLFFFFVFSYWRVGILNRPDQTGRSEYSVSWFDAHRILCFSHFFFSSSSSSTLQQQQTKDVGLSHLTTDRLLFPLSLNKAKLKGRKENERRVFFLFQAFYCAP